MNPYIVFAAVVALGAALSWILPGRLHVPEHRVEEKVLAGLLPVLAWVIWSLRRREAEAPPQEPAPAPASKQQ